jgi:Ca2+-binding EF-hand superfamily protein
MDVAGRHASVWTYLRDRYDGDGDGRITAEEYGRDAARFARLDRDGDGAITAVDVEGASRRPGRPGRDGRAPGRRPMLAQRLVAMSFQDDGDASSMTVVEAARAFAAYDTNADGRIDEAEFTCAAVARRVMPPGVNERMLERLGRETTVWAAMVEAVDGDRDGMIGWTELVEFVRPLADAEGVWTIGAANGRARPGEGRASRGSGPAVGAMAPDFELRPPDGGAPVRLSSFRHERAVALIFGSYT